MSSSGKFFLFILLLPFLAAIGHDVYYSYFSDDEKIEQIEQMDIDPNAFKLSDLGWVWQTYHPGSLAQAKNEIAPEIWKEKIDPILQNYTFVVALAPFLMGSIFCLLARILGVWPFTQIGSRLMRNKNEDYAVYKHAKSKATKYTRK